MVFEDKKYFDGHAYMAQLAAANRLAQTEGFHVCSCSGINSLQDVLSNFRSKKAFICIDDTNNTSTEQNGGGWFRQRTFTVFLLYRYKFGDMADRAAKLDICRQLFRQFHSRFIRDKNAYIDIDHSFIDVSSILSRELGEYFISGCTGLYFMTKLDEPINLMYDEKEWQ